MCVVGVFTYVCMYIGLEECGEIRQSICKFTLCIKYEFVMYSKFQLRSHLQFPVTGNLWFVRAVGCNVELNPWLNQTIRFPKTAKSI